MAGWVQLKRRHNGLGRSCRKGSTAENRLVSVIADTFQNELKRKVILSRQRPCSQKCLSELVQSSGIAAIRLTQLLTSPP